MLLLIIADMQGLLVTAVDYPRLGVGFVAVTEPSLRTILAEQRQDLGLVQADIGKEIGLKRGMVSILEREPEELKARGVTFTLKFFKAYKFSDAKAREMTQELFNDVLRELAPAVPPNASPATADGPTAMHYGPVSAGIVGHTNPPKPYPTNIPSWLARKYDPADIFVLTVEGDSMTCDDIRKSIPEGTEVYFHKHLQPENGEIVAVWLEDRDFGVIKLYKPKRDTTVLQSYNFKHPPILIDENNPAMIQGVYVGKSEPSWTRFDR